MSNCPCKISYNGINGFYIPLNLAHLLWLNYAREMIQLMNVSLLKLIFCSGHEVGPLVMDFQHVADERASSSKHKIISAKASMYEDDENEKSDTVADASDLAIWSNTFSLEVIFLNFSYMWTCLCMQTCINTNI